MIEAHGIYFMKTISKFRFVGQKKYLIAATCILVLASCTVGILPKHLLPVPETALILIGQKKMKLGAPIFIRIFKQESELEIWKQREDGHFYHFKTYPICTWSGNLGPKRRHGDKQAPEGFYTVNENQLNPNSDFHLSFNLGYPNGYDRSHGRTGKFLMVHGRCTSVGCYAMTDSLMEEIFSLAREAFYGGQKVIHVHAFPFRMVRFEMSRNSQDPNFLFWQRLKQGYDYFELTRIPPQIAVCNKEYHVNVKWEGGELDPTELCPKFIRPELPLFVPKAGEELLVSQRIVAPGLRRRVFMPDQHNPKASYNFKKSQILTSTSSRNEVLVNGSDNIGAFINLIIPPSPPIVRR
ncbi:MAG: hypothetical protein TECD_01194 [Hyphomicrobiaceae bacterium hypho_1]